MTSGAIGYDLYAIERELNVGRLRSEELLASFGGHSCVQGRHGEDADRNLHLAGNLPSDGRQKIFLNLAETGLVWLHIPRREVSHLPVVAIIGHEDLGTYPHDLPVEAEDTAVVRHVPVHHRHAHVAKDAVCQIILEELHKALPGMQEGVALKEEILTKVTGDLELRTCAEGTALRLGFPYGYPDPFQVAREVHGPLVEVACGNLHKPRHGAAEAAP
mmetsp:Transcript_85337/g.189665  ORF Transcript_85337/g.189665 Transcript_85337/m.189665 type:complete len:217 (+) Transcript_85337:1587-2237(+)